MSLFSPKAPTFQQPTTQGAADQRAQDILLYRHRQALLQGPSANILNKFPPYGNAPRITPSVPAASPLPAVQALAGMKGGGK